MKIHYQLALLVGLSVTMAACDSQKSNSTDPGPDPDLTNAAATLDDVLSLGAQDDAIALEIVALQNDIDGIKAGGRNNDAVAFEDGDTVASIVARMRQ